MDQTTQAFLYSEYGNSGVLKFDTIPLLAPQAGELRLRQTAIGVNYIDIYQRSGLYPAAQFPARIGVEGVGVVEQIGDDVQGFAPGDRIAYVGGPPGGYADRRNVPAARAIKLPEGIKDTVAAALIFKAITAEYLIHRCYPVQPGQSVLVHAAAGGVGSLLVQWLKAKGATVIATVGRDAKVAAAQSNGADHVLLSGDPNLAKQVKHLMGGVDVVYDSIGKDTFTASLDSLKPRGMMVSFGSASGPVPPFALDDLSKRGSLFITRPSIAHYTSHPEDLRASAERVFDAIKANDIRPSKTTELPLHDAPRSHAMLENRQTTGALILIP